MLLRAEGNELLEALTWLAAVHRVALRDGRCWVESADLVDRLRASPLVQARLAMLAGSEDRWIREAAEACSP